MNQMNRYFLDITKYQEVYKWVLFAVVSTLLMGTSIIQSSITRASGEENLNSTIQNEATLTTLAELIQLTGLSGTLEDESQEFTVFAPNNAAFSALPDQTLSALQLEENRDDLIQLLQYHVVAGTVMASSLSNEQVITTIQGEQLTVSIEDGTVQLVDAMENEFSIITTDINATNGVVHIVEGVLLDKVYAYAESETDTYATVVEYIQNRTELSTLLAAIEAADLVSTLQNASSDITVLAPTNQAFEKLPEGALEEFLKPENLSKLQRLLRYHVVNVSTLGELTDGKTFETLTGDTLTVVVNDDGEFIQDAAGNLSRITLPVSTSDGSSIGIAAGSVYNLDTVLTADAAEEEEDSLEDTGLNIIIPFIIGTILMIIAVKVYTKSSQTS